MKLHLGCGNSILEKNKKYSDEYIQKVNNPVVPKKIKDILVKNKVKSVVDLGCGDGALIYAIKKEFPAIKIVGVDISPRRIGGLKKNLPSEKFYVRDVCDTKLKDMFDFIHSGQVIEHVKDDNKMVDEMYRLLKDGGILYVSSVIKKPWAIYQYRNKGKFVLDPTHEREYGGREEFLNLFEPKFELIKCNVYPVRMPKFGFSIRIPGYYIVEGVWRK